MLFTLTEVQRRRRDTKLCRLPSVRTLRPVSSQAFRNWSGNHVKLLQSERNRNTGKEYLQVIYTNLSYFMAECQHLDCCQTIPTFLLHSLFLAKIVNTLCFINQI